MINLTSSLIINDSARRILSLESRLRKVEADIFEKDLDFSRRRLEVLARQKADAQETHMRLRSQLGLPYRWV